MSKNTYGITSDIYSNFNKAEVLLSVKDIKEYLESPPTMFIIIKGKVKVHFSVNSN